MNPETNQSARPAEQARCPVCLQHLLWLDWSLVWQCEYCGWQGTTEERETERAAQQEYEDAYYAQRREAAAGYADPAQASPDLAAILAGWQREGKIEIIPLSTVTADVARGTLSPAVEVV